MLRAHLVLALLILAVSGTAGGQSVLRSVPDLMEGAAPEYLEKSGGECADANMEETDHYALKNLFTKMNGENWVRKEKWMSEEPYCSWEGVTCEGNRVVKLEMRENGVAGEIPEDLSLLTALEHLDVSLNKVQVSSLAPFSALTNLKALDISGANLAFSVSSMVNTLQRLESITVDNVSATDETFGPFASKSLVVLNATGLKGKDGVLTSVKFDKEIGLPKLMEFRMNAVDKSQKFESDLDFCSLLDNAPKLIHFEASGSLSSKHFDLGCLNGVNGTVRAVQHIEASYMTGNLVMSSEFREIMPLHTLILRGTPFDMKLLKTLPLVSTMKHVDISECGLDGLMPLMYAWRNFKHLQHVNMSHNRLVGGVTELGGLENVEHIDVSHNQFYGGIVGLFSSPKLKFLDLSNNNFFGPIPTSMGASGDSALEYLDLGGNRFDICVASGSLKGKLPRLRYLALNGGNCETAPDAFVDLPALEELVMSKSNIQKLPDSYGSFPALKRLDLSENKIGAIPASIQGLKALTELDVSSNEITTVPNEITKLESLSILRLNKNKMSALQWALNSLIKSSKWVETMEVLDISDNALPSVTMTDGFAYLANLRELRMANCQVRGSLNSYVYFNSQKLEKLEVLDLSGNQLEGELPSGIRKAASLRVLNVSNNKFSATLPAFAESSPLVELSAENNSFRGPFPVMFNAESQVKSKIAKLNLHKNTFTGELPAADKLPLLNRDNCNVSENGWSNADSWAERCVV